jgi:hypothetical protein
VGGGRKLERKKQMLYEAEIKRDISPRWGKRVKNRSYELSCLIKQGTREMYKTKNKKNKKEDCPSLEWEEQRDRRT